MNINEVLNSHNLKTNKAQEEYDLSINKINEDTANNLENLSLEEFEKLSLDKLYKLLNNAYWQSEKRINEVIDIIERKKIEYRKEHGFVLYKELNKLDLSNEIKMKIEDKLIIICNSRLRVDKEFLLKEVLDENKEINDKIWEDVISALIESNNTSIDYNIKCKDSSCNRIMVQFKNKTIHWVDFIIKDIDNFRKTGELTYSNKAYEKLSNFTIDKDDFVCPECYEEFGIEDIYDDLKNLKSNPSILIFSPMKYVDKDFYPIKGSYKIIGG